MFDVDAKVSQACLGHIRTLVSDMHVADLVQEKSSAVI